MSKTGVWFLDDLGFQFLDVQDDDYLRDAAFHLLTPIFLPAVDVTCIGWQTLDIGEQHMQGYHHEQLLPIRKRYVAQEKSSTLTDNASWSWFLREIRLGFRRFLLGDEQELRFIGGPAH